MKLRRLRIDRLAGIDRPFELEALGDGLNLIIGPNGIGKSRICTAVRALLWEECGVSGQGLSARADFDHEGTRWQVVRNGSLHRWQREGIDAAGPALPSAHLDRCFFLGLRDLLDDSDGAGHDLSGRIRKQMLGGFDLDAVEQRFRNAVGTRAGGSEARKLEAAEKRVRDAERVQIDLKRREGNVESLESKAVEAERASKRLDAFGTAISLCGLQTDRLLRQGELAELPESLSVLDGKEIGRLDKVLESLEQKRVERAEAEEALDASREAARGTRLGAPIDPAALATWRARSEKLSELESRLEAARVDMAEAREAFAESRALLGPYTALGVESDRDRALGIEDDFDLFLFLRHSHETATTRDAATARLRLLTPLSFSDQEARRLELLRRGIEPLRRWLRAPDPDLKPSAEVAAPSSSWRIIAAASVILLAVGLAMQAWISVSAYSLVAVGAGIGLAAAALSLRFNALHSPAKSDGADSTDWRSVAARQFPESLDPPSGWSTDAVTESLSRLEDELTTHDANQKRARDRGVEIHTLKDDLNGLEQRSEELETRRRILFARLGLDSMRPDVEMVDLARALDASRTAHLKSRRAAAKLEEFEAQHAELLEGFARDLAETGESEPIDGPSARASIHSLETRDGALREARAGEIREGKICDRLDREIAGLDAEKLEIYRQAGIEAEDRGELIRVLSHLDRFRGLDREILKFTVLIEQAKQELDTTGEASLADWDLDLLKKEQAALGRISEQGEDLKSQISETRREAGEMRKGHSLEDAIADRATAITALRDLREEAFAAVVGVSLIESVRSEHEDNQMPRVLERARIHFATFTHHRYQLKVAPDEGGSFVAVDTQSGEGLSPNQLSDGTRAQLILAARLAFAEEAEGGADLPLFLDEALDHSDPERFHAIALSLARMVTDEGRQIFYLSNDPTDIERFQRAFDEAESAAPQIIDLAEIRGQAARIDDFEALHVAALEIVPAPAVGQDAESYGLMIKVSSLDLRHDVFRQPLYYLLRDDLSLLHRYLEARIDSIGQCRNDLKTAGSLLAKFVEARSDTDGESDRDLAARLGARIELFEAFCLAWREGRGAPVGRLDLEASKAVTETYLDAVVEVASELKGDARQLIQALRERKDSRLSGYRDKATDSLERFFIDGGQLDDRPILDETGLTEKVVGTPAAIQLSPKVAAEWLHQWWQLSQQTTIDED